jgi:O-antigen/teichoic acid export membrane protein
MTDLKGRALRGGLAKLCGQAANFILRFGYIMVLARLLSPDDFGLVATVTVVTGVYELFTSAGLSSAMIQRTTVTNEQVSKLFWANLLFGVLLSLICVATAPVLVAFFHEPRLFWVTIAMAPAFLLGAASVQHMAILQRELRYITVAAIELVSLVASVSVGIGMALAGFGYWAIVGAALALQTVTTIGAIGVTRWVPGRFNSSTEIGPMLRYGATLCLNSLVAYVAFNFDKLLIGRVWGADALGLYGRAYQLVNIPIANLNMAVGGVAFAALSRLQDDPARLKTYFLKGYSLVVSMTIPVTIFCGVFADDIIRVVLGPKWMAAAPIFRLMSPTILIFAVANPLSWLLFAVGLHRRSLNIALALLPVLVAAYFIGLPYGPSGVAAAFSIAMALWLIPLVIWCLHGTMISPKDLLLAVGKPLIAGLAAAGVALSIEVSVCDQLMLPAVAKLFVGGGTMFVVYAGVLLFILGQKDFYLDLIRGLKSPPPNESYGSAV